ncbi:FHIPEP family type III secretion protein [Salmonella enterica subsp. enterica]|nr:FHIPEP family type III secretion protein [Salmonella enterica subsp. enterica]
MEGEHTGAAAARLGRSSFLVGGNFAIGIVVLSSSSSSTSWSSPKARTCAEVGARFVLDGMPGKQMAIDADLNAGLIGEDEGQNGVWRKSLRKPTSTARWTGQ